MAAPKNRPPTDDDLRRCLDFGAAQSRRGLDLVPRRATDLGLERVEPIGVLGDEGDVEHAAAILGYDRAADDEWGRTRARLVHEAGHLYVRRRAIVDAVPEALLRSPVAPSAGELATCRAGLATAGH